MDDHLCLKEEETYYSQLLYNRHQVSFAYSNFQTLCPATISNLCSANPFFCNTWLRNSKHPCCMENKQKLLVFTLFCFSLLPSLSGSIGVVEAPNKQQHHYDSHRHLFRCKPSKLFVFGDSYADTGNLPISFARSWKNPYGITFPGKPSGRFSNGRVSTDYLARFIGVRSPIPYRWRKFAGNHLKYGMNFAYGGSGVLDTLPPLPNITTQIDFFQQAINDKLYSPADIQCSVALVSIAGNDYSAYIARNGTSQGLPAFITQLVNQLAVNLRRIRGLGVKKVAVNALQPLGCLPSSTAASSFKQCNETQNQLVGLHNLKLQQAVAKLNSETKEPTFILLDFYSAFMTVFKNKGEKPGSAGFKNPLKPCCVGVSSEYNCGNVDENGVKKYTVCENPDSAFFWDSVHPTQAGWRAVYAALQTTLKTNLVNY